MENENASPSWRTPPPPVPESEITQEYSADVIVIGLGNAGTPATRAAAETGASVIAIEKMKKEKYRAYGHDIGHINSDFLASKGVPKADPIEYFNEWMSRSGNRANPRLVMQFCQKSGEAFNWYTEQFTQEEMDCIVVHYWPPAQKLTQETYQQKFWVGTAHFTDQYANKTDDKVIFRLTDANLANQKIAEEHGAKLHFGMDAQQLVLDGGRVVGVIAKDDKDQYVKYNANKGVILAAGDFGGNQEMLYDLVTDVVDILDEGEQIKTQGRDGSGIQMGVWAGGRLEARPIATMGGNTSFPMTACGNIGTLWVDENGKRFCNEGFGDPIFSGFPAAQLKRQNNTVIFDSSILEDLQYSPPAHTSFFINDEASEKRLKDSMEGARAAGAEGYSPRGPAKLYAANTFEELADYIGFKDNAKQNFLETVKRYNELCAIGRDEDFGKNAPLLNVLDEPPYYAQSYWSGGTVGFFLVTVGGLLTDEYQNVLNQQKDPIPGLYATGNCCGRRFGLQYSTPTSGVSNGIALALGREVGRIVAEL